MVRCSKHWAAGHAYDRGDCAATTEAENTHLLVLRRERKMQRFESEGQALRLVSIRGAIYNVFNVQRHLISRSTPRALGAKAMNQWIAASAASA